MSNTRSVLMFLLEIWMLLHIFRYVSIVYCPCAQLHNCTPIKDFRECLRWIYPQFHIKYKYISARQIHAEIDFWNLCLKNFFSTRHHRFFRKSRNFGEKLILIITCEWTVRSISDFVHSITKKWSLMRLRCLQSKYEILIKTRVWPSDL